MGDLQSKREQFVVGDPVSYVVRVHGGEDRKMRARIVEVRRAACRIQIDETGRMLVARFADLIPDARAAATRAKAPPVDAPAASPSDAAAAPVVASRRPDLAPTAAAARTNLQAWISMGAEVEEEIKVLEAIDRADVVALLHERDQIDREIQEARDRHAETRASMEAIASIRSQLKGGRNG